MMNINSTNDELADSTSSSPHRKSNAVDESCMVDMQSTVESNDPLQQTALVASAELTSQLQSALSSNSKTVSSLASLLLLLDCVHLREPRRDRERDDAPPPLRLLRLDVLPQRDLLDASAEGSAVAAVFVGNGSRVVRNSTSYIV